jgi:hypothetical protein
MEREAGFGFRARLARREQLWWGKPFRWAEPRSYRDALHRLRERRALRSQDDPEEAWRCCERWQRTLVNKWNAREFVKRERVRVPELYWHGLVRQLPLESLPPCFVIRPLWGRRRRGAYVVADGRELLRGESAAPAELRQRLARDRALRSVPILVEQFATTEDGRHRLPLEYKCHTFGDTVAAVQVIERTGVDSGSTRHRYYSPAWEPFRDPMEALPQDEVRSPPACLEEMLEIAARLGRSLRTYMRIDFFSSEPGCVFNEFSSAPAIRSRPFTPHCDELFGALWNEKFPDAS